jgi:hypothetical protein
LFKEKIVQYALDKKLGGLQSRSGYGNEGKNILPLPGIKSLLLIKLC